MYNEKEQALIIEQIFDVILTKFKKEYQQVITYCGKDNSFQESVFNTNDLMCSIFQFLTDFDLHSNLVIYELMNCSLVNSHWLYHTWNPNSIYSVSLYKLITQSIRYQKNSLYSRMWQRYCNAQKIYAYAEREHVRLNLSKDVLNKLAMFTNILYINGYVPSTHLDLLKVIVNKCDKKIEKFMLNVTDFYIILIVKKLVWYTGYSP